MKAFRAPDDGKVIWCAGTAWMRNLHIAGDAAFRIAFRLEAPALQQPPWQLYYLIQAKDDPICSITGESASFPSNEYAVNAPSAVKLVAPASFKKLRRESELLAFFSAIPSYSSGTGVPRSQWYSKKLLNFSIASGSSVPILNSTSPVLFPKAL